MQVSELGEKGNFVLNQERKDKQDPANPFYPSFLGSKTSHPANPKILPFLIQTI